MRNLTSHIIQHFLVVAILGAAAALAHAQGYPSRDLTFIVPYNPGGSTDPISRQFAAQLEKTLPATINMENKPGGSATIGSGVIVRSKPDGYTIGLGSASALAYQPLVNSGLAYKTPDDYQPIVKLVDLPAILVVRADAPWKTFAEFMADVKKNPGKIRASVSGLRETSDLVVQQLNRVGNVKITTIPFTGGGGEALVALLGGRVEATVGFGPGALAHVQGGKVKVLAVFKKGKYDLFPDATPVGDAGYDATLQATYYVVAPKGMPKDVQDKLVKASLQAVRSDEFHKFASDKGYVADPKGPEETKAELVYYGKVFADLLKFIDSGAQAK
ncbi:MAG: tripartite tricarboxylate transporter substrate binding protein [Herminiimonas sp.]|nr:tripartite tricarboxylate transporter substrate binding protein [Herminiimonas sp.]